MTSMKLFLDDKRHPPDDSWHVVRTVDEAVLFIDHWGVPNFISFDHDLGEDKQGNELPNGSDLSKIIVEKVLDKKWVLPEDFSFKVHSSNFDGGDNIWYRMHNLIRHQKNE